MRFGLIDKARYSKGVLLGKAILALHTRGNKLVFDQKIQRSWAGNSERAAGPVIDNLSGFFVACRLPPISETGRIQIKIHDKFISQHKQRCSFDSSTRD